jgi:hypothetical protein
MDMLEQRILGVIVALLGCLPLFEMLIQHSSFLRGDQARTTRRQDQTGYLAVMLFTVLLAAGAAATGIAIFAGAVPL